MEPLWKEEYLLGIKEMDEQHKKLLNSLFVLHEALILKKENKEIVSLLADAKRDVNFHLDAEEKYLDEFGCDGANEHKFLHNSFRDILNIIGNNFMGEENNIPVYLLETLERWFIGHVKAIDKKYVDCFHEHNVY